MIGGGTQTSAYVNVPGGTGNVTADLAAGLPSAQASQVIGTANDQGSVGAAPYVFVGIIGLYLAWAILARHERISESLRPANVAVNFHNVLNVTVMAIIGIVGGKVLFTKLTAFDIPVVSKAAAYVGQIWAAA